jgi:hypothetical protein
MLDLKLLNKQYYQMMLRIIVYTFEVCLFVTLGFKDKPLKWWLHPFRSDEDALDDSPHHAPPRFMV